MGRRLEVWCSGEHAGTLCESDEGLRFAYSPNWVQARRHPLSQSLPVGAQLEPGPVAAFFGGLLPEGRPREVVARRLGLSVSNDFALLEAIGGECAGAVRFLPPEAGASLSDAGTVLWLSEDELAQLIKDLPANPMHADADGEFRLSLAGAQDKLPVVVDGPNVGLTKGDRPSTHILKTPIDRLPDTVANEAFCLALGRRLGIETAQGEVRYANDQECLLVARYDRTADEVPRRLHQEDMCQALGVASEHKYQAEGGPSLANVADVLRSATIVPAVALLALLDSIALSFIVGNHDAHAKNFSLLYAPDRVMLAPAYDVLSTIAYADVRGMSRKTAMKIGGEYRPKYVRRRHLERLCVELGLAVPPTLRRLSRLAGDAPKAAREVLEQMVRDGTAAPINDRIVALVDERSAMLVEMTGPGSRPRTQTDVSETDEGPRPDRQP